MDLPDLKDLAKVIDLCRKKGVASITIGAVKLELREEAPQSNYRKKYVEETDPVDPYKNFPTDTLTPEQLVYYSSGGLPESDPALKDKHET